MILLLFFSKCAQMGFQGTIGAHQKCYMYSSIYGMGSRKGQRVTRRVARRVARRPEAAFCGLCVVCICLCVQACRVCVVFDAVRSQVMPKDSDYNKICKLCV